jgi:hypothetical protein
VRFLWILHSLHPDIVDVYKKHRVMSMSGEEGSGVAIDGINELVSTESIAA